MSRMIGTVQGKELSNEYLLKSAKGHASLPLWRTENREEALQFMLARLPNNIKTGSAADVAGNQRPDPR